MERGHGRNGRESSRRKREVIEVVVHHVEAIRARVRASGHHRPKRQEVRLVAFVAPQRTLDDRDEWRTHFRIAARENHHVVAARDERLREPADHTLGAAIAARRDALERWRKEADTH